ncbi:MAG: nucleotide disphospho-sugar-binding domain-containing protein [Planctomycetota bacterium]
MSESRWIAFVAPPFGGHLFPQLELAERIRECVDAEVCFFSTPEAAAAVELAGFEFAAVISDQGPKVIEISDTPTQVGSNPFRLLSQFRSNLGLMGQLREELRLHWEQRRPDMVIVDFTVPIAGLLAKEMDVRWWTSMPTPCAMETADGTPTYLGGWMPATSKFGSLRDAAGRQLIRGFKCGVHRMFRKQLASIGVASIYREDGTEAIYSDEKVLALGLREFEFDRTWPSPVEFVGPLTRSPAFEHDSPVFESGKRHVLVSLGTHLWWAKGTARKLIHAVAEEMPEFVFHFSDGRHRDEATGAYPLLESNFHRYKYLPYDRYMAQYDAAIHHGGTGVLYSCLQHAVPALVWPQDYDQFDHAARLVHHGLGKRMRPTVDGIVADMRELVDGAVCREPLERFRLLANSNAALKSILQDLC